MSRNSGERWFFLFFSFVVLIFSASYVPTVYGNDPTSIERYLAVHEGRQRLIASRSVRVAWRAASAKSSPDEA